MPAKARNGALRAVLWVLLTGALSSAAQAQGLLPLWELGGGATVLRLPDYRGSEEIRNYVFPIPWVVYRGDFFRADREGVRARLFDSERIEPQRQHSGSVPVDSDRNRARQGMEDLRPLFEVGPARQYSLWRTDDRLAATRSALAGARSVYVSEWCAQRRLRVSLRN